jgi:hypothetical protein
MGLATTKVKASRFELEDSICEGFEESLVVEDIWKLLQGCRIFLVYLFLFSWADHYLYNLLGLLYRLAVFFNFYFILIKWYQLPFNCLDDLGLLIILVLFSAHRQISIPMFQRSMQLSSVLRLLKRHRFLLHKLSVPVTFWATVFFPWLIEYALLL